MKGSEQKLISYLQGSDKRFVIPVYQRKYDWKLENCKKLYEDLLKVVRQPLKSHFFGSIVSYYNADAEKEEYQIIDGQQRITTISLLLLAMYHLMKQGIVKPEKENLSKKIYNTYLVDEYGDEDDYIKVIPVKGDREAFLHLFTGDVSEYIASAHSTINYQYFYDRIRKEEVSIDDLFNAISKLEIINIKLNHEDNPQLIFESLNSTGLALSESDKIRNFILMALSTKEQNLYHDKYWSKIEKCTGDEISNFIRDYLSIKQQTIPAMNKVYFTFKTYVEESKIAIEDLLADLLLYAKRYELLLLKKKMSDKKLNACIYRLNRLETSVTRPFLLQVLRLHEEQKITLDEMREIFLYTENYIFRRAICDLPTNSLNKVFLLLHREIVRYEGNEQAYLNKFKYALRSKKEKARFPEDDEFVKNFSERQVYLMNSKNKIYILERIENIDTLEDKSVYEHVDNGEYTIEHIMPQHLTPAWRNELGDNYEQIHEEWLHRIANLTLTAYNSKYSNNSFVEKRDMEHGFKDSGLRMNTYLAQQTKWTLEELEQRNDKLMKQALLIWKCPSTEYKPAEKQLDSCSLDDDVNLSGKFIAKYAYKNMEQPVTSWIDMYKAILKSLHDDDKSVLSQLSVLNQSDDGLASYVSNNESALRNAIEIDKGIYIEGNTNTEMKISLLRKLFKLYGAEPSHLVFYLKDDTETTSDEAGTRYEVRRKYWAYALPMIQKAHEDTGCFGGWTSTKENWMTGFFGIGGFAIGVVSNYDVARVEVDLASGSKEKNKAAYDYLHTVKDEIEQELGIEVNWLRSEDTKGSYITYKLEGVSIYDETDWTMMAKFQAEWSKKFYDAFVPRLRKFNEQFKLY